jgi:regulator of CtrA degradation
MADRRAGEQEATEGGHMVPFDALQGEVARLAEAARDYLAAERDGTLSGDPVRHLIATCEATRLVSRLGYCIAWLLARRAVQSGEIAHEAAAAVGGLGRLGGREACLAEPPPGDGGAAELPSGLAELLERSVVLYRRVERLDRALDG